MQPQASRYRPRGQACTSACNPSRSSFVVHRSSKPSGLALPHIHTNTNVGTFTINPSTLLLPAERRLQCFMLPPAMDIPPPMRQSLVYLFHANFFPYIATAEPSSTLRVGPLELCTALSHSATTPTHKAGEAPLYCGASCLLLIAGGGRMVGGRMLKSHFALCHIQPLHLANFYLCALQKPLPLHSLFCLVKASIDTTAIVLRTPPTILPIQSYPYRPHNGTRRPTVEV